MDIKAFFDERQRALTPTQIIVLFFAGVILVGALLLNLPAASRESGSAGFFSSLFTAISATCVAGFSLKDIWTQWSPFGQGVILLMIEIGGLGFMSTVIFFSMMNRRRVGMKQRMALAQALGLDDVGDIVRMELWVIKNSLIVQGIGWVMLFFGFLPHYGWKRAVQMGFSHAVSAFCNCGLDFMGFSGEGAAFTNHITDPLIMIPMTLLIIYGGLGFIVLDQLFKYRKTRKLNVYARLVLITTGVLLGVGTVGYLVLEWSNPGTLGPMNIPQKIMAAFFQSANTRTAGFAGISQEAMVEESKALTCILMIIGGAAGSTSGGIKTATLAVLVLYTLARFQGKRNVTVYNRRITNHQVLDAMTITGMMLGLGFLGGLFISVNSDVNVGPAVFSSISAIATCGLSIAETALLNKGSQILIMLFMFFGRVGILSISLSFIVSDPAEDRIQRAETKLIIG